MKRTFLLIGIFLITLVSYGQKKTIQFGIKGGLNYSSFIDNHGNNEFPIEYKGKIGFYIGGFTSFEISKKLSIRPEVLYSQQDSDFIIDTSNQRFFGIGGEIIIPQIEGKIKESILFIPIILEYKLNEKLNFGVGSQFGYSINRELEFEEWRSEIGRNIMKNDDSELFQIDIALELGYSFSSDYLISARYNYGIIERQNLNSSVIQLGINYKL